MEPIRLEVGRTRCAVVPEAGGRLHQLEIFDGHDWLPLLFSSDDPRDTLAAPTMSGSYAMVPWPNRIAAGIFTFQDDTYIVPQNHHGHAIHGFGFDRPWRIDSRTETACRLSLDFGEAWPFGARAVQEIEVQDDAIIQRVEVRATAGPSPAGAGWHPWFRRDVRPDAQPRVGVPADEIYETAHETPTGKLLPVAGDTDLRDGPELRDRRLDTCYRGVRAPMSIRWGDIELTMEQSPDVAHAVVYTPPEAFCVEPQTCAIDAFNLAARGFADSGAVTVTPGSPLVATTTWRWRIDG